MTEMQRNKGNRGEREFCKILGDYLGETLLRQLGASRDGGADVIVSALWAVEIKREETLRLNEWWHQAIQQAANLSRYPALAYRQSRQSWKVIIPLDILLFGKPQWIDEDLDRNSATLGIQGFATVVRETWCIKP